MLNIFQTQDFYFFRKPHGVASTFGKEKSFLDYVFVEKQKLPDSLLGYQNLQESILQYLDQQIQSLKINPIQDPNKQKDIIQDLINIFGKDKEYGLLNRLDNDTGGLLYFAKSPEIYDTYKGQQSQKLISKYYIAQVNGNPFFKSDPKESDIDYPIMHHRSQEDRMICIVKYGDENNGTGKQHLVSTHISLINFDQDQNISTLLVCISKGIRHQIRVHLSSIGCSIIGENIYSKNKSKDFLHLFSVGFIFNRQKNKGNEIFLDDGVIPTTSKNFKFEGSEEIKDF